MARRNSFAEGLLSGLYQSGVGNPEVNEARKAREQQQQIQQAQLNQNAADNGQVPDVHPIMKDPSFLSGLKNILFPGSGGQGIQTAFKPDPTQSAYDQDSKGQVSLTPPGQPTPTGSVRLDKSKGSSLLASQNKPVSPYLGYRNDQLEYLKDRLNYQKVNEISKRTGIQPKVVAQLQTNNMRADRALQRLSQDNMTWQDFNTVITDWQGIMQGGVPHQLQYADSKFPNWKETVAKWQTFATANPTESVPPELRSYMADVVSGLKEVDNNYLKQNSEFVGKTIGATIPGYDKGLGKTVKEGTNLLTQGAVKKKVPGGTNQTGWDDSQESRLQELLKKQQQGTLNK